MAAVKRRGVLLVLAGLLLVAAVLARSTPPTPALVLATASAPPVTLQAPLPPPPLAPVDAGAPVALAPAAVPFERLDQGFCSATGLDSFTIDATLPGLAARELARLQGAGPAGVEEALALREAVNLRQAEAAARPYPRSLLAQVMIAVHAVREGETDTYVEALRRAWALEPGNRALGWALARATLESPDLDEAIAGLHAVLSDQVPRPAVSRVLARLEVQRDLQRGYRRTRLEGLTVLYAPEALTAAQADQLALTIDRDLGEAAELTGLPRRRRLTVIVYPGRSELLAASCARSWSGGLYDGSLRLVAGSGPEALDWKAVRHETLHAQVSPWLPRAPAWFHEGLAQSFARQEPPRRLWREMVRSHAWAPFASLDGNFHDFETARDASLVYAQSYAMVDYLRDLRGDQAIRDAVRGFQGPTPGDTASVMAEASRRDAVSGADVLAYLERRLATGAP